MVSHKNQNFLDNKDNEMSINSLEMAYNILNKGVTDFLKSRRWDKAYNKSRIIDDSVKVGHYRVLNNEVITEHQHASNIDLFEVSDALLYIRDTILKETGKRIWGLTFTLYPDGAYEIQYDYNVPEGFNEKGEWIGEEHNNEAVSELFDNIRKIGTDDFELK